MIWFYLDGEDSREYGVYLRSVPEILSAEPDIEFVHIPGRDGSLTQDNGGYKDQGIALECYIKDVARLGEAYGFMSGYHELVISADMTRKYRATFYGAAEAVRVVRNMKAWEMSVPVKLKPFRYFEPEAEALTVQASGSPVNNPGTAPAAPRITIAGNGDITLMIGIYIMEFEGVVNGIIIDSDKRQLLTYDGTARALDQDIDEFPILVPGANYIQWTGSISSLTIEPRWRDR